ncbi:helix-turn-helix domain-containing protein [Lacticaseibacillus jixiensis]|uniref:helix-turn-helix domain-containing protein n=1 Tax=Lacticaseibacillus jixiensis TaxID=3231926 RepID=UPI0036F41C2A
MENTFDRIKKQARRRGLTLKELATRAAVSRQTMYTWQQPDITPSATLVDGIAKVLDVEVLYLLAVTDDPGHYKRHRPSEADMITELHKNLSNSLTLIQALSREHSIGAAQYDPDVCEIANLIQALSPADRQTIRTHVVSLLNR